MTLSTDQVYLGHYRVVREISSAGASSVVYELYHVSLEQRRALKRGLADGRVPAERLARLFETEKEVLNRLDARGLFAPALFESDLAVPELVMTYFDGPPLRWVLDRWLKGVAPFPDDDRLVRFARRLAGAVERCHERDVALADLKPDNVIVEAGDKPGEGRPVLIDFGSALLLDRPVPLERDFTAGYAAPELVSGAPTGKPADVYSLGAMLYALFRRAEPSIDHPIRDFGERRTVVPPALQRLVLTMTADDPGARPPLADVIARLDEIATDLEDRRAGVECPKCHQPLPVGGSKHCPHCGKPVSRETRKYSQAGGGSDPIGQMYTAAQNGLPAEGVYWAKAAFRRQPLTAPQRLIALELALQLPLEVPFARALVSGVDPSRLPPDVRRPFLAALGQYLRLAGEPFAPYREAYRGATVEWPTDERLWAGLADATPISERERVLRDGLDRVPQSVPLLEALGDLVLQTRGAGAALPVWREAIHRGHRAVAFLCRAWHVAQAADVETCEQVAALLRAVTPRTAAEARLVLAVAEEEWRAAQAAGGVPDAGWRLAVTDAALALEPARTEFREARATALFDQGKYVLAIEYAEKSGYTPVLREVLGKAYFMDRRYAEARQVLEELTATAPTPARFVYLIKSFAALRDERGVRDAIVRGYRQFPNSAAIRALYDQFQR